MSEKNIKETKIIEPDQDNQEQDSLAKRIRDEIVSWVMPIVLAIAIALFVNNFIIVNATVPTGSMENTIMPNDRLIGYRLAYRNEDPERGDIVIFKYPVDETQKYIKRIIALPGETVEILDGKIYIDGSPIPLDEPYLKEEWTITNDGMIFEVPEESYLVLGDNRNNSLDARYWAEEALRAGVATDFDEATNYCYVAKDKILGKAIVQYWPHVHKLSD